MSPEALALLPGAADSLTLQEAPGVERPPCPEDTPLLLRTPRPPPLSSEMIVRAPLAACRHAGVTDSPQVERTRDRGVPKVVPAVAVKFG